MQATNSAYDGGHEPDTGQQRQTNGADQLPPLPPPPSHDNRSAWPPNMSFASSLQQGSGFNTTNAGYHKHRPVHPHHNGFGQPKQPRQQNFVDRHELLPDVLRLIDANYRVLVCMRGAPGSGKSYLARAIVDRTMNGNYADHIFTTDDYFVDARTKQYRFDRGRLSEAHDRNQAKVARRAADGWSPIVVDNTSMKVWEMQPYFREAVKHGYLIRILEPNTPWRIAVGKLAQRNSHGVDQEQIARMLTNYEPASVQDVLHSMQIFNYDNPEPRLRSRPDIVEVARGVQQHGGDSRPSRFQPRDQRPFYQTERNHAFRAAAAVEVDDISSKLQEFEPFEQEWQPFEQETESFWGTEQAGEPTPKPAPKVAGDTNIANMYKILQDRRPNEAPPASGKPRSAEPLPLLLRRHKKFCRNESRAFQEVRQICPNIPVRLLWDLFEKCNGDGDWTVDLILNERESMGIETLDTQEAIDRDNFACDCDRAPVGSGAGSELSALAAVPPIAADTTKSRIAPSQMAVRRKQQMADTDHEVRRQINELFVIPDKHYSQHTRKIRDIRYGGAGGTAAVAGADEAGEASGGAGADADDGQDEPGEIIEMDLGIGLVCQLDRSFGSTGLQQEQLKSLKTTVFMPKTLGQQLYAIWVESLYNQLEEQRHQSVKDDEEFALELHKQEQTAEAAGPPPLAAIKPPIADIADIELAWKAYNTNFNEWKQTTPEDLATKLTKDKLFEIFPHVDRQQLLHVFSAYSNNFRSTVDFFKEELKSDVDKNLLTSGQKLLDHVRLEAETVSWMGTTLFWGGFWRKLRIFRGKW